MLTPQGSSLSPANGAAGLLILGPGQHGEDLATALRFSGVCLSTVENWPIPRQLDSSQREVRRLKWYPVVQRASWAAWRRVPHLQPYLTPRHLEGIIVDNFAAQQVDGCRVLWAWSQMSLKTMRRAKALQIGPVLLEHPTSHVDTFSELLEEERVHWTPGIPSTYSQIPPALRARMRAECDLADQIVVLSTFARQSFLEAGVPDSRLTTVRLGIDTDVFRPGRGAVGEGLRLLVVGRIELRKGFQYLCEAARRLGHRGVEILLAGPLLPEARPVLDRYGELNIKVLGSVPRLDLPDLYGSVDLVVLPSVEDAFGLVILEAMSCGVPVLATEHTGGPDIITEGEDGWVVPARDSRALSDRIDQALSNRSRLRQMGGAARHKISAAFTRAHYEDQVSSMLNRLGIQS